MWPRTTIPHGRIPDTVRGVASPAPKRAQRDDSLGWECFVTSWRWRTACSYWKTAKQGKVAVQDFLSSHRPAINKKGKSQRPLSLQLAARPFATCERETGRADSLFSRLCLVSGGAGARAPGKHLQTLGMETANGHAVTFTDPLSPHGKTAAMEFSRQPLVWASMLLQPRARSQPKRVAVEYSRSAVAPPLARGWATRNF